MRRLALLVSGLLLALTALTWAGSAPVVTAQEGYAPDAEELAFVDLVNGYRASLGLGTLTLNYELGAAADYKSYDMATNNYFDHYGLDGTDPGTNIQRFGYTGYPWAENIASGMGTAQEVLIAWQNSPEHDATMRNPNFTEIGIGRAYNEASYYGWYWTATYGGGEAPAPVEAAPAAPVDTLPDPVVAAPAAEAPLLTATDVNGNVALDGSTTTVQEPATIVTEDGGVVELQQPVVNADGDRAVSTGANPVADGTGDTVIYGDINTGGVTGETVVYEPPSLTVAGDGPAPAPATTTTSTTTTTTTTSYTPPPAEPVYTDPTLTETTVTNISMEEGNGRAIGG
jgi:uncharacterized protein YkwD